MRPFHRTLISNQRPWLYPMNTIASEEVDHIIRRSLQREIELLEMKKRITDDDIKDFKRKYDMD